MKESNSSEENMNTVTRTKNSKLFVVSMLFYFLFSSLLFLGFRQVAAQVFFNTLGYPEELEWLLFGYLTFLAGLVGAGLGILVSLIIIRHVGNRWRKNLKFGKHPILYISCLAFFTYLVSACILLYILSKHF